LLGEVLPKMGRLKSLTLNLNLTLVSDISIETFAEKMLPSVKSLENFDLRLWDTKVTDKSIGMIFTKMEKVKKFILDLGYTGVTNEGIQNLANITMPTMKAIEEFKLGLTKTNVNDDCISEIFYAIENVNIKHLAFYLHGTNITDKSIDIFAKQTLPRLQRLEVIEIRLGETKVSDQGVIQLLQNLERVKKLILKLQSGGVTDKIAEAFIKSIYPSMKALEEFDMDVSDTKISEKYATQLARIKEKLAG